MENEEEKWKTKGRSCRVRLDKRKMERRRWRKKEGSKKEEDDENDARNICVHAQ